MLVHDRGTYRCEKWRDDEVIVSLAVSGPPAATSCSPPAGKDWMVRRTDPRAAGLDADAGPGPPDARHAGRRGSPATAPPGGTSCAGTASGRWRTSPAGGCGCSPRPTRRSPAAYPWLRAMAEALAPTEAVLDGVLVRIDGAGRVRPVRPATGSRVPPAPST